MSPINVPVTRRQFLHTALPAALSTLYTLPALGDSQSVNLYNWDRYIGESTLEDFNNTTRITVHSDVYHNTSEMLARLSADNTDVDVVIPSNHGVERLLQSQALLPLDYSLIPNTTHINQGFLSAPFDPGRQFSLPYLWSAIGIGYRKSAIKKTPSSWHSLLSSNEYAGRIALLKDHDILIQIALQTLGLHRNKEGIARAESMIKAQRSNIAVFAPDNGQDLLLAGEVDIAMEWSSDIKPVIQEDDDIGFVIPSEGSLIWEDCLCIPKNAPNIENAHTLINYLLDPVINTNIAQQTNTYPGSDHHKHLFYKL